jgi:hypothetical protein
MLGMPYFSVWLLFSSCLGLTCFIGIYMLMVAFSVDLLYNVILQYDLLVDNNKKIWKMKIPLKTKKIA